MLLLIYMPFSKESQPSRKEVPPGLWVSLYAAEHFLLSTILSAGLRDLYFPFVAFPKAQPTSILFGSSYPLPRALLSSYATLLSRSDLTGYRTKRLSPLVVHHSPFSLHFRK
jgi:hypothetical protein